MLALIDGDIVRYRTGFASNDVSEGIACARAKETMEQILEAVEADSYRLYLSDTKDNNFRYKLYPRYKESRERMPKPVHHEVIKDYLMDRWGAVITPNQEADDALGIDQTNEFQGTVQIAHDTWETFQTVICSIDKDLLQVPGKHYNWVKDEFREIEWLQGTRSFFEQCLKGDRTDDILGLQGIGDKKAARALAGASSEEEMLEIVRSMWQDDEALLLTGRLLWVRRYPNQLWDFSIHDTTLSSSFSTSEQQDLDNSLEPTGVEKNGSPVVGSEADDTFPTTESPVLI